MFPYYNFQYIFESHSKTKPNKKKPKKKKTKPNGVLAQKKPHTFFVVVVVLQAQFVSRFSGFMILDLSQTQKNNSIV